MNAVSRTTRKKSWQLRVETATLQAAMADRQARVALALTEIREREGLTQEDAAARMGITLRQWQRWESGESEPYKRNVAKLSETFGVAVGEFFDEPTVDRLGQLDRIEQKLDDLLGIFRPTSQPGEEGALSDDTGALQPLLDYLRQELADQPTETRRAPRSARGSG